MYVLITSPQPAADATATVLRNRGWQPVVTSFSTVQPLQVNLPPADDMQAILLTNAESLESVSPDYRGLRLLVLGDALAEQARLKGFKQVYSTVGKSVNLANLAGRLLNPNAKPIQLLVGQGQGEALRAALVALGFLVRTTISFEFGPPNAFPKEAERALASSRTRAVLFFSLGAAQAFGRLLPAAIRPTIAQVDALATSTEVADHLSLMPWGRIFVATTPTQKDLLALL